MDRRDGDGRVGAGCGDGADRRAATPHRVSRDSQSSAHLHSVRVNAYGGEFALIVASDHRLPRHSSIS